MARCAQLSPQALLGRGGRLAGRRREDPGTLIVVAPLQGAQRLIVVGP